MLAPPASKNICNKFYFRLDFPPQVSYNTHILKGTENDIFRGFQVIRSKKMTTGAFVFSTAAFIISLVVLFVVLTAND